MVKRSRLINQFTSATSVPLKYLKYNFILFGWMIVFEIALINQLLCVQGTPVSERAVPVAIFETDPGKTQPFFH